MQKDPKNPDAPILSTLPLLELRGLTIGFGGTTPAVHPLSLIIAGGETLGLVGQSGSGKSTVSLALMGLLPPNATVTGQALFSEECGEPIDLLTLPAEQMRTLRGRRIAMIFQEPMTALNPAMRVGDQIAEAITAHCGGRNQPPKPARAALRTRVLEAMDAVALPDPAARYRDYPHQFSGGQRQRLLIAMALVHQPQLLIADEPTTALDVTVQAQILELLANLRRTHGLAMLFISHDLAVVGEVADRIGVLHRGELVELGAARDVLLHPQHPYTQSLIASVPTLATDRTQPLAQLAS